MGFWIGLHAVWFRVRPGLFKSLRLAWNSPKPPREADSRHRPPCPTSVFFMHAFCCLCELSGVHGNITGETQIPHGWPIASSPLILGLLRQSADPAGHLPSQGLNCPRKKLLSLVTGWALSLIPRSSPWEARDLHWLPFASWLMEEEPWEKYVSQSQGQTSIELNECRQGGSSSWVRLRCWGEGQGSRYITQCFLPVSALELGCFCGGWL